MSMDVAAIFLVITSDMISQKKIFVKLKSILRFIFRTPKTDC